MDMIKVIKRDGAIENFDKLKIEKAILKATNNTININEDKLKKIINEIAVELYVHHSSNIVEEDLRSTVTVEQIHDTVIHMLNQNKEFELAANYSYYRGERDKTRQKKTKLMKSIAAIGKETDRDNANVGNNFSSKLLRIASETNKVYNLSVMPKRLSRAHEIGDIHQHDLDSFNLTTNCLHIPSDAISKGFNTGYGYLRKAKRLETAAELCCILLQSTQNDMFGGQSFPNFDNMLGKFIPYTYNEITETYKVFADKEILDEDDIRKVEIKFNKTIHQAMQGIVYNMNTMHSRAGSQVPFSSVNIGIPEGDEDEQKNAAIACQAFLEEYERGLGKGEQPIFPNIIFRVKKGINAEPNDPYFYLLKLACRVASKRMNPTFMNLDADFNKEYYDKGYLPATMGCRTYLMSNVNGEPGVEGRGNIAPTTMNLPRIGLLANKNIEEFYKLLDTRLRLASDSLMYRYEVLKKLKIKDMPFVAGQELMKGTEGLSMEDSIEPILKQGTWGIGFIGLAETLIALTGKHHGECEKSRKLGLEIITYIRNYCNELTKKTHLNWSCYASPAEGLSGRFIQMDKAKFGIIEGVTDKNYYSNSFHVPVGYNISISDKILIEAPYHKLCNGGHISYIELDGQPTEETILRIITQAYSNTNINYIGINFHIKYCKECGTYLTDEENVCSSCGSDDIQGISRVTGYLSLDERFGIGKAAERADRKSHNGEHKYIYNI